MNYNELEILARAAIEQKGKSPFGYISPPVVQVSHTSKLLRSSFPFPITYVGEHKGKHVYNFCAHEVLKAIERHKLEFDIHPKNP